MVTSLNCIFFDTLETCLNCKSDFLVVRGNFNKKIIKECVFKNFHVVLDSFNPVADLQ